MMSGAYESYDCLECFGGGGNSSKIPHYKFATLTTRLQDREGYKVGLKFEIEVLCYVALSVYRADFVMILFECLEKLSSLKSIFRHE